MLEPSLTDHYCSQYSSPPSDILNWVERQTHLKTLRAQMLSGHLQGRMLSFVSHLMRPTSVLEIGTFTGYATLCLAEGLAEGGKIISIEANPELERWARASFQRSDYSDAIELIIGDAKTILPNLDGLFDLVFIDAKKLEYETYYEQVIDKVKVGGVIIADNVLWHGLVPAQQSESDDPRTVALHLFNEKIQQDARVENFILPMRDGLNVVRKVRS